MGIIEIDKLDTLLARHAELKVAVDAFGQTLNEVQRYVNETNIVVKDIYNGTNATDWISDLKASGKSSVTYGSKDRMTFLLTYSEAVNNTDVNQYIFDYGIENNLNIGGFYKVLCGTFADFTWDGLTTFDAVCKNSKAFGAICKSLKAVRLIIANQTAFGVMANNYTVTERIISSYGSGNVAYEEFKKQEETFSFSGATSSKTEILKNPCWIAQIGNKSTYMSNVDTRITWEYVKMDGTVKTFSNVTSADDRGKYGELNETYPNCFAKKVNILKIEHSGYTNASATGRLRGARVEK